MNKITTAERLCLVFNNDFSNKKADFEKYVNYLIDNNCLEDLYICASVVTNMELETKRKIENTIIKTGGVADLYCFARDIEWANIERLEDAIIKRGNGEYIYCFAKNIKDSNKNKLEAAVIQSGEIEYIYRFAFIGGVNINDIENVIIQSKDAYYIYLFALTVEGANISALEGSLINTESEYFICEFAKNINGANIERLEDAIITIGNLDSIKKFNEEVRSSERLEHIINLLESYDDSKLNNNVYNEIKVTKKHS